MIVDGKTLSMRLVEEGLSNRRRDLRDLSDNIRELAARVTNINVQIVAAEADIAELEALHAKLTAETNSDITKENRTS